MRAESKVARHFTDVVRAPQVDTGYWEFYNVGKLVVGELFVFPESKDEYFVLYHVVPSGFGRGVFYPNKSFTHVLKCDWPRNEIACRSSQGLISKDEDAAAFMNERITALNKLGITVKYIYHAHQNAICKFPAQDDGDCPEQH